MGRRLPLGLAGLLTLGACLRKVNTLLYMIYSDAFDALPPPARDAVYARMWRILSGQDAAPKYARLTAADRRAIVEILRDTKKELPEYFRPAYFR